MKIGTVVVVRQTEKLEDEFRKLKDLNFEACQISGTTPEFYTDENVKLVVDLKKKYNIEITAMGCGWGEPRIWDFVYGHESIGLVPPAYRFEGIKALKKASDFCKATGIPNVVSHVGYIPNNPNDNEYTGTIAALKNIVQHCKRNGTYFLFETGQETPVTLLRTIEDISCDYAGINLDPANLLMYGMGNPIDAIDVFGKYVKHVHAKDGLCPVTGRKLGLETPLGEGKVNYPLFIEKLKSIGYDGYLIIEREISGEQQTKDIIASRILLKSLI